MKKSSHYWLMKHQIFHSRNRFISFVLGYVDDNCNIQVRFIGMVVVEQTDSQTLVDTIET